MGFDLPQPSSYLTAAGAWDNYRNIYLQSRTLKLLTVGLYCLTSSTSTSVKWWSVVFRTVIKKNDNMA